MHERVDLLAPSLVTLDADLEQEFEARLVDTSRLAFRVAFSVLRHQQDAEDVAQESLVKAYRHFSRLRERDRFRSWMVRMAWRAALDRQRANRRRGEGHDCAEVATLLRIPKGTVKSRLFLARQRLKEALR